MKRISIFLFLGILLAAPGFAQSDLQPAAIVRLTRSEPITVKQLRTEVERYEKQYNRVLTAAERRQILDVMINEKLVMQAADRDRIAVTDNELNQQIGQLRTNMSRSVGRQPTDAEFAAAVKNETGLEMPLFREQIKKQLLLQKYMTEKKKDSFTSMQAPTESDIQNAYQLSKSRLVRPETVHFSIISVPYTDAASKTKARETIDRISRDIGGDPSKFDEISLRGQTPNAGYTAGDGGYLPRNPQARQVVGEEFLNTAFSLKQGEVSRVIENTRGYQIIKITGTYEQKNLELDDIFQLGSRMTVRDYIGNSLLQERQEALIEKVSQELVSELRRGNPYQIMEANINW